MDTKHYKEIKWKDIWSWICNHVWWFIYLLNFEIIIILIQYCIRDDIQINEDEFFYWAFFLYVQTFLELLIHNFFG